MVNSFIMADKIQVTWTDGVKFVRQTYDTVDALLSPPETGFEGGGGWVNEYN
jgi:hypothetical protein